MKKNNPYTAKEDAKKALLKDARKNMLNGKKKINKIARIK